MSIIDDIRDKYYSLITVEEIKGLKPADLKKEDVYQNILATVVDPMYGVEQAKAANLLMELEKVIELDKKFSSTKPVVYKNYQHILNYLRFNVLFSLSPNDIEELFTKQVLFAIEWGIDIFQKVNFTFDTLDFDPNQINPIREAILRGLKKNREKIGSQKINLDDKDIEPTISNWLRDYNYFFEVRSSKRKLDEVTYINRGENVRRLKNKEEKDLLFEVIKLYNYVWRPAPEQSAPVTGHRLPSKPLASPEIEIQFEGESLDEPEISSTIEEEVLAAYRGDPKQQKAITKEEQKIAKKFQNNMTGLRTEFFATVQRKNINRTIAILRFLTAQKELEKFIKEDDKLNKFLATLWEKRYGKGLAAEFSKKSEQLKFSRLFLRYVLEERLDLSISDASRIGLQIGNIFVSLGKKGYNKMAYFDVKSKEFNWFE